MQIVIDIHERDYQSMLNGHIPFSVLDAIRKGTPLPKGHGRENCIYANECIMYEPKMKRCKEYKESGNDYV